MTAPFNNASFSLAFGGNGFSNISGALSSRTVTGNTQLLSSDNIIYVNGSGPVSLTGPVSPIDKQILLIKDVSGNAHTNNITFIGTVDGIVNPIIGSDYGGVFLSWNGTTWSEHA